MKTLTERLEEVMQAKGWEHADLVRVSGESSSVVSQWLGKGSKTIHSIGKMEAAERIEAESGYCALWIAKGKGQKHVAPISRMSESTPYTVNLYSDTNTVRAPVVEWSRLESVLFEGKLPQGGRTLPYELEDGIGPGCVYVVVERDNLAPDVRPGDRLLIDPDNLAPESDQVTLFRINGALEFMRYRKTHSGFEAYDSTSRSPYDSSKHAIEVLAACVGSFKRHV
ncbi:MAG: hypothetical protein KGI52_12455 [Burkholderiales bacterium]|nr:hypothetical protein [Burkholderiales bacterium]